MATCFWQFGDGSEAEPTKHPGPLPSICLSSPASLKQFICPYVSSSDCVGSLYWEVPWCTGTTGALAQAGWRFDVTPWCTRSSHNAMLPAGGLLGLPGWGIQGVSTCWCCGGKQREEEGGHGQCGRGLCLTADWCHVIMTHIQLLWRCGDFHGSLLPPRKKPCSDKYDLSVISPYRGPLPVFHL